MTEVMADAQTEEADTQSGKYLTFFLDKESFGIDIRYVTEIVGIQKIRPLPESPDYIKGVINLRGDIIPVIDMRLRLKKESAAYTDRTCIIVVEITGMQVGLIVDRVEEVASISDSDIVPPPDFKSGYQSRYIQGIGKKGDEIRLILNCERLFNAEELKSFSQINMNDREK